MLGRGFGSRSALLASLTASSPLSLGSVKTGGVQGGPGEVFDLAEVVDQRFLAGLDVFTRGTAVESLQITLVAVQDNELLNEQGSFAAPPVFRRDPAVPANALVGIG